MEAGALKGPPVLLERIVLVFVPPAAREVVGGDLWELYRSPLQYVAEALRTIPLVTASQIRRNLNVPVAGIQAFLIFCFFGGPAAGAPAVIAAVTSLCAMLLLAAYQGARPPSISRAALETILVSIGILVISVGQHDVLHGQAAYDLGWGVWSLVMVGSLPALSLFRTRLILENDRRLPCLDRDMTMADLAADYRRFALRANRRNRIEAAILMAAALLAAFVCRRLPQSPENWAMAGLYGAASLYLSLSGKIPSLPAKADFVSLRALYQHELARHNRLRHLIWWLWLTPLLSEIYARFIGNGAATARPIHMTSGILAAILLCFFLVAVNSERNGRVQENISLLARMRERKPC